MKKLLLIAVLALAACTEPTLPSPPSTQEPSPTTIAEPSASPSIAPTEAPSVEIPSPVPTPPKTDA